MSSPSEKDRAADPRVVIEVLRRRGAVVLACLLIAAGAALVSSVSATKQYTASATLLFRDPNFDQKLFGNSVVGSNDPQRDAATNVQLVGLGTISILTAKSMHLPQAIVRGAVKVKADGQSNLVSVTATRPSPRQASLIANEFARAFITFRRDGDQSTIKNAQAVIERQLARMTPVQRNGSAGRSLRSRVEQLELLAALQTGNVSLVQTATVPVAASSPRLRRNVFLGALFGLLVGVALAILLERIDRRVREVDELETLLEIPLLGIVPESRTYAADGARAPKLLSAEAEAFRMLRARLRYFDIDRHVKTVVVTSALPGEGKSTVAWQLAVAAATGHDRTLVVEADLRRPTMGTRHGLAPGPGLSELLTQDYNVDDVIRRVPIGDEPAAFAVSVIPAGAIPPNPSALLESQRMSELLAKLTPEYDLIVIDTPPTSLVSDAMPLVTLVDGVIVVSRLSRSMRDSLRRLRGDLLALRAPLLGFVANGVLASGAYGYRYRSGYGGYGMEPESVNVPSDTVGKSTR
jgi:capsular exopolysaccharide synthesis family protein